MLGSFYSIECAQVREEGRVAPIEAMGDREVHRAWDLGIGDDTSIWHFQVVGSQIFVLHHMASSGMSLERWVDRLKAVGEQYGWRAGTDYVPHDAKVREFTSGRTRVETMQAMGLRPALVPDHRVDDGINAARRTLPLCVFHPRTEESGLAALEQYRREWDDDAKTFKKTAVHDWTSHPADAFRYLAMSWVKAARREAPTPQVQGFVIPPPDDPRKGIRL